MELNLGQPQADTGLIKDATTASFAADVLDASVETPVIVDFWAPWCGPCKQLGPVIEKAVANAGGKVKLVKINIDENPEIAQQMRIQSIPAVYAFAGGRPVDGFVGALPESQIKSFIDRLVQAAGGGDAGPSPVEEAHEQAQQAEQQGDYQTAGAIYQQLVQHDPEDRKAKAGLAHALVKTGQPDAARQLIDGLPPAELDAPEYAAAKAALELAAQAEEASGKLGELKAKVEANPADLQARFDLAVAQSATGQSEEAIDNLLQIIERNRTWNEGAARDQLLTIFDALGPADELTVSGRRRLSSILFS